MYDESRLSKEKRAAFASKLDMTDKYTSKLAGERDPNKVKKYTSKLATYKVTVMDLWECFDVSNFWRTTGRAKFKQVAKAAMVALSAPSAESIAERVFSQGKLVKSAKRTQLGVKHFEAATLLAFDKE